MRRLWSRWVAFWSRRESGISIALFRIMLGLCVSVEMFNAWRLRLPEAIWVDAAFGGYRAFRGVPWLVELLGGASPIVINGLLGSTLFLGAALTLGIGGRLTSFCCLQGYLALTDVNTHAGGSYDELLMNGLWILVLAPGTATLSVDCRLRTGKWWSDDEVMAFGRYLVIFQLLLMYWTTGLQKVSAYWVPGGDFSALYYILQQPSWHRGDMSWLASYFWVTQVGTAVSWIWEVSAPLWMLSLWFSSTPEKGGFVRYWFNRLGVKWVYFAVGVIFHFGVVLVMEIGPFSIVSLAFYFCLVSPVEWDALRKRVNHWLGKRAAIAS